MDVTQEFVDLMVRLSNVRVRLDAARELLDVGALELKRLIEDAASTAVAPSEWPCCIARADDPDAPHSVSCSRMQ